ncbi:Hypothetical predicted protein [Pelobates cultripes]|uniref:Uncharacterized protein n=1 Tax=Pelobates cultripes TaxID=61616 RepID=A0AAD1VKP6_PELCU|nr:Hypothetical predicted protein [Pelobates cultripes]
MAATRDEYTRGKQQQPASPDLNLKLRDSLDVIFDKFWTQLLAHTRPATAIPLTVPPTVLASSTKRTGKPLMGTKNRQTPATCMNRPPGQRATRGLTRRYRPHKRRAAGTTWKHTPDPCTAQRTRPLGRTLDLKGPQARGRKVPALTLTQGRGGTMSTKGCIADLLYILDCSYTQLRTGIG